MRRVGQCSAVGFYRSNGLDFLLGQEFRWWVPRSAPLSLLTFSRSLAAWCERGFEWFGLGLSLSLKNVNSLFQTLNSTDYSQNEY